MSNLRKLLSNELNMFRKLSVHARHLAASIMLYEIADIGIYIFAYAFLFQKTSNFAAAATFNMGLYITLPFAYILTAFLLKKFSLRQISLVGLVGQGLTLCSLFFIPNLTLMTMFIIGLILGIPMGLYWSCRLFLYTSEVPNSQRDYFSGITQSFSSVMKVAIPMVFGWLIASAPALGFSKLSAYQLIAIIGTLSFVASGIALHPTPTLHPKITQIFLHKPSKRWNWFRLFIFAGSIEFTIAIAIPESLTLRYLGNEAVLGTVFAALNILGGLSLYIFGRIVNTAHRTKILFLSLVPLVLSTFLMLADFSRTTIIIYFLADMIFNTFFWFIYFPLLSNEVETDTKNDLAKSYPYYVDHEIFINGGRIMMSLIYLWLTGTFATDMAITFTVLIGAFSQIGLLIASYKLKHEVVKA